MDLKGIVAGYSEEIEQAVLTELLNHGRYTQGELCNLLNINPKTLRAKLQKFRLSTREAGPKFF
jgi:DNA-binding protein Fis